MPLGKVNSLANTAPRPETLLEHTDFLRVEASSMLDPDVRADMGQFLTPAPVAGYTLATRHTHAGVDASP